MIPSDSKDVEQWELPVLSSGVLNWYNHCGKQFGNILVKLKNHMSYDPTIPFLGIYSRETQMDEQEYSWQHYLQ